MPNTLAADRTARDVNISLRASSQQRALIDLRYFALDAEAFEAFTGMLDRPPAANPRLRRLLTETAPWDR